MSKQALTQPTELNPVISDLTVDQLKGIMPARQKQNITVSLVNEINQLIVDPDHREMFKENIIGYVDVLKDPNTTLPGYIAAVRYVSFKMMGLSNQDSWMRTFPQRYERLVLKGAEDKYIRSLVCAYNKGKMVNAILEQTIIPCWVINQDVFQKAINVQAILMVKAKSEKVRAEAANSILNHLKRPEAAKLELDIGIHADETVKELKETMILLAKKQQELIADGIANAQEVAESAIIEGESERIV